MEPTNEFCCGFDVVAAHEGSFSSIYVPRNDFDGTHVFDAVFAQREAREEDGADPHVRRGHQAVGDAQVAHLHHRNMTSDEVFPPLKFPCSHRSRALLPIYSIQVLVHHKSTTSNNKNLLLVASFLRVKCTRQPDGRLVGNIIEDLRSFRAAGCSSWWRRRSCAGRGRATAGRSAPAASAAPAARTAVNRRRRTRRSSPTGRPWPARRPPRRTPTPSLEQQTNPEKSSYCKKLPLSFIENNGRHSWGKDRQILRDDIENYKSMAVKLDTGVKMKVIKDLKGP